MSPAHQTLQDITNEAARSAPPVAVTTAMIAGLSVSDWAAILTIIYVALQIFFLLKRQFSKKTEPEKEVVEGSDDS